MDRFRVLGVGQQAQQRMSDPLRVAVQVAADAALTQRSRVLTGEQLDVFETAAPFAGVSVGELERVVAGAGDCVGQDPEAFFPAYAEDPAHEENLMQERELARRLCGGCPVRGACVAADWALAAGAVKVARETSGVSHIWGIRGLGARDRRALLPLWVELRARISAGDPMPARVAAGSSVAGAARRAS